MSTVTTNDRPLIPAMRWMLLAASILVFAVGIPLFLASEETARYFSWTIQPPLTAAFLGAAYWSSFFLEFFCSREKLWSKARIAVPAVLTFTALTLVVTLLHINRFHFDFAFTDPDARATEFITLAGTWVWLAVYAFVPIIMGLLLILQLRVPGKDPAIQAPIQPLIRWAAFFQAAVMIIIGIALLIVPTAIIPFWPWKLTALTGRAIGAWLVGLGIAAAQVGYENDWIRVRSGAISYTAFAVLELIALFRYLNILNWNSLSTWFYLVFLLSILIVGAYGVISSQNRVK